MTPELWTTIIVALISAFIGGIGSQLIRLPLEKKKIIAEAKKTEADAFLTRAQAMTLIEGYYKGVLDEREKYINELEKKIDNVGLEQASQNTIIKDLKFRLHDTEIRLKGTEEELKNTRIELKGALKRVGALEVENKKLTKERDDLLNKLG